MNSPRILLLGSSVEGGGAETRFVRLARHLFSGELDVVALRRPDQAVEGLPAGIAYLDWKSEWSYPLIILRLRRKLLRQRYDAIFGFGRFPNLVAWASTVRLKTKPILVLSEVTQPWTDLSGLSRSPKTALQKLLVRCAYGKADFFLANSIDGIEESVQHLGVQKKVTARVPNLIDFKELRSRAAERSSVAWPANQSVLLASGRLDRQKRLDTLIQALALLPPELDCAVVILGSGDEERRLKNLACRLGVAARVHFAGWVKNPFPLFRAASVLAHCSEREGFSNAVLEAMCLGVPVVSSLCSSDTRRLAAAGAILGFEPGAAHELAHALVRLLSSEKLRQQLVTAGQVESRHHELSAGIRVYENLIRHACDLR